MEEEVQRAGKIETAEDADTILSVLSAWLSALRSAAPTPEKQQQPHQQGAAASRPRWRQPPLVVWNALCVLLPLLAAPALERAIRELPELLTTIFNAATGVNQYQCVPLLHWGQGLARDSILIVRIVRMPVAVQRRGPRVCR